MSSEPYSIGSLGSKKINSSILKEVLEGSMNIKPLLIIKIDGNIKLSLENTVAKLTATMIIIISTISTFSLAILL